MSLFARKPPNLPRVSLGFLLWTGCCFCFGFHNKKEHIGVVEAIVQTLMWNSWDERNESLLFYLLPRTVAKRSKEIFAPRDVFELPPAQTIARRARRPRPVNLIEPMVLDHITLSTHTPSILMAEDLQYVLIQIDHVRPRDIFKALRFDDRSSLRCF